MTELYTTWNLEKYFYKDINSDEFIHDWNTIDVKNKEFIKKYQGKIKNFTAEDFIGYFKDSNIFHDLVGKIGFFIHYLSALDTQNHEIIKKEGEFNHLMTEISNSQLFILEEFKEIGFDKLMEFANNKILLPWKNYFYQKAQSLKYLLEEKTEFVLNLKSNSSGSAFKQLYEELTNSFLFKIELDGEVKELTDAEIRTLRLHTDPSIRRKALLALREVYNDKKVQITLGNVYKSVVRDYVSDMRIRGYKTVMSQRNISEELDDDVVNLLLKEIQNAYPLYHEYLNLKAKFFGWDKIHVADMYAPYEESEVEYPFEKGKEIVFEVLNKFDPKFEEFAKSMFDEGRADVYPNPGKRGGAFASYDKDFPSFILLNYTNKISDVSTMVHELGHAMHGHLSQAQPNQVYGSPLSLAETASIFNEMLLGEKLFGELSDKDKISYLAKRIEDVFGTIFRQVQYVLFERRVHEIIHAGKDLTYKDFNLMWREEQEKLFGGKIEFDVPPEQDSGWSTIPHIHMWPFYCYAYAFGNLVTFSLYDRYTKYGEKFVEEYKDILRAGGSKTPDELLSAHGFDIKSEEFYKSGINVLKKMIDQLSELIDKHK